MFSDYSNISHSKIFPAISEPSRILIFFEALKPIFDVKLPLPAQTECS